MTDSKVRAISPAKREPDAAIISVLESLLARAKAGELVDLVCVWSTAGEYDNDWVINGDQYGVTGYMTHIRGQIIQDINDD